MAPFGDATVRGATGVGAAAIVGAFAASVSRARANVIVVV